MKKLGLIVPFDYKLLSIAAILDVFETVNRFYSREDKPKPFDIILLHTSDSQYERTDMIMNYPAEDIKTAQLKQLILVPAFNTDNINETLAENTIGYVCGGANRATRRRFAYHLLGDK